MIVDLKIKYNTIRDQNRINQLTGIFFYGFAAWIIGANLLYFTENNFTSHGGPYDNYWKSYWHIIIVLFSGIEDKEPISLLGRIEVTALLIAGICFAGIITGEIVSILVNKIQRAGKINIKPPNTILEQHIVIIGHNQHINNIINQINAALKSRHYILIVCRRAEKLQATDTCLYKKVLALQGDTLSPVILDQISIDKALRVIVLASLGRKGDTSKEVDNRSLMKTIAIAGRNSQIPVVVEIQREETLKSVSPLEGAEFVVSKLFGERLASQAVLSPGVTEIYDSLMTFTDDSSEFYTIPVIKTLVGKTFKEAQLYFLDMDEEAIILLGIDRSPHHLPNTDFILNPVSPDSKAKPEDLVLKKEDNLVLIAFERPNFAMVEKEDLWEGKIIPRNFKTMLSSAIVMKK